MTTARYILYFILIVSAFMTIQTNKLRRAVIYLGIFSLISSVVYLLLYAPDVAIAEAIIGCTISVVLFLTALRRYKIFTIYYVPDKETAASKRIIEAFEKYLVENEFDPQLIYTTLDDPHVHENENFDVLVVHSDNRIILYSSATSYHTPLIREFIDRGECDPNEISCFSLSSEESEYET